MGNTPGKDRYIKNLKNEIQHKNNEIGYKNNEITTLQGERDRKLYNSGNSEVLPFEDNKIVDDPSSVVDTNFGTNSGLKEKVRVYSRSASILDNKLTDSELNNDKLTSENALLASLPISNYSISFIEVQTQNKLIDNQINDIKQEYSTDTQKVNYQSEKIYTLKKINYVLFIMYYFIVLIFTLVLIMYNTTFTKYFKILIVILFLLFPFMSDILYQLIVYLYNYIFAMLNGNAYTSNNY
jgi:hypothetical protein